MQAVVLHHLKAEELPAEWAKKLPAGQTFTVTIVPELPQAEVTQPKELSAEGALFGLWKDHPLVQNVDDYVRNLRKSRTHAV